MLIGITITLNIIVSTAYGRMNLLSHVGCEEIYFVIFLTEMFCITFSKIIIFISSVTTYTIIATFIINFSQ